MPDYHCWPIWHDGSDDVGPINQSGLGPSLELVDAFDKWQDEYDQSLNMADSLSSQLADQDRFEAEGRRLAGALQEQLGRTYVVRYWEDRWFQERRRRGRWLFRSVDATAWSVVGTFRWRHPSLGAWVVYPECQKRES